MQEYKIKLEPGSKEEAKIITELKDGSRPLVTVEGKDGQDVKLRIEAMPRYGNINFYQTNGKPEKREDFLKVPKQQQGLSKTSAKDKQQAETQEMSI